MPECHDCPHRFLFSTTTSAENVWAGEFEMSLVKESGEAIRVLSFDSGGPGTYSQLLIVKQYMNRVAADLGISEDDVYPADYFDLIGGVGFGGLAAIMMGHIRMNTNQAIDTLLTVASSVFPDEPREENDLTLNTQNLKEAVENMLMNAHIPLDMKMSDHRRPAGSCKVVLYAASSANLGHAQPFRTYESRGSTFNPMLVEGICATLSFPSLFLPTKIGARMRQQSFVGGALGASNPTRELLNEAANIFGKDRRVAQIISIGAGVPRAISLESSPEIIEIDKMLQSLSTDCEIVAKELSNRLFTVDAYLRLNVDRGMEAISMADWSALGGIESHTNAYVETAAVAEAFEASLGRLRSRVGSLSLGQLNHTSSIKIVAKEAPAVSPYYVMRNIPWELMVHHLVKSPHSHQKIFSITGMGGCGKTQMVSYFLREYRSLYKNVVFADASSKLSIQSDLQTWARSLGSGHERDVWEDGLQILASSSNTERSILILDNADDPALNLVPFLSQNENVTIIITSRNRTLGNLSTTYHLELGELETEEALTTLLNAARRQLPLPADDLKNAYTILRELGCLAVAIVQVGTYCHELSSSAQPYSFTQYLSLFYKHRADLMKKAEPSSLDNYQRGAYSAFDLSYNVIPKTAQIFLHYVSFFHFTDIPLMALKTATENKFEDVESGYLPRPEEYKRVVSTLSEVLCADEKWNDLQVQETIRVLRSFSLLSVTSVDDTVFLQIHPLVQSWSRDLAASDSQLYEAMAVQTLTSCCSRENFRLHRYLLPHILDMLARDKPIISHVNDQMAVGRILYQNGSYTNAVTLFTTANKGMKDVGEERIQQKTTVTAWLADTLRTIGRWEEAEKFQLDILEQRRRIIGIEDPDTINAAANLAKTYQSRGRWAEAEELQVDVLEKTKRILGAEDRSTIIAAADLAATYQSLGRWEEAETLELGVLEHRRKLLGMEHPETIVAAANLAATYRSRRRWDDAESLQVEVLEKQRRVLGSEHPHTLMAIGHLAFTYHLQGRWAESEALKLDLLEQQQKLLGMEHPDTITSQANLAATYGAQGLREKQVRILAPAVQLSLKVMGQGHPNTQVFIEELAKTYDALGRKEEARETRLLLSKVE